MCVKIKLYTYKNMNSWCLFIDIRYISYISRSQPSKCYKSGHRLHRCHRPVPAPGARHCSSRPIFGTRPAQRCPAMSSDGRCCDAVALRSLRRSVWFRVKLHEARNGGLAMSDGLTFTPGRGTPEPLPQCAPWQHIFEAPGKVNAIKAIK